MRKRVMLFNLVQSQVAWFAAVLLAAHGHPLEGTLAALGLTALEIARSPDPSAELRLVLWAAAVGAFGDSLLVHGHLLTFTAGTLVPGWTAPWMVALWMNFATVLNQSLRVLHGRVVMPGVLGALGGPLAYAGGARLGAIALTPVPAALAGVAVEWLIALPVLCALAKAPSLTAAR